MIALPGVVEETGPVFDSLNHPGIQDKNREPGNGFILHECVGYASCMLPGRHDDAMTHGIA